MPCGVFWGCGRFRGVGGRILHSHSLLMLSALLNPNGGKPGAAILSLSFSHHYQPLFSSKIYIDLCTCEEVGWMEIRFEFWPYFFILGALLSFSLWILWSFSDRKQSNQMRYFYCLHDMEVRFEDTKAIHIKHNLSLLSRIVWFGYRNYIRRQKDRKPCVLLSYSTPFVFTQIFNWPKCNETCKT